MSFVTKFFLSLIVVGTSVPAVALMADPADPYGFKASAPDSLKKGIAGGTEVPVIVGNIINIALSMIGIIFFLILVYAGFTWMLARGNTEAVDKSKAMIEGAVIGLIIVIAAYAITTFVFESLDKGPTATPASTATSATPDASCVGKSDSDICDLNSVCASGKCVSKCQQEGGVCGAPAACAAPGKVELNLCPGGASNVCCKS